MKIHLGFLADTTGLALGVLQQVGLAEERIELGPRQVLLEQIALLGIFEDVLLKEQPVAERVWNTVVLPLQDVLELSTPGPSRGPPKTREGSSGVRVE